MSSKPSSLQDTSKSLKLGAVVGFLVFVELASGFVQGYYLPLLGQIANYAGVTDAEITLFVAVQTLSAAVSVPVLSKLGDIFGHRRILRIAIVIVLLGTLLTAFSSNYALILIGRALQGPLGVWLPLEVALVHNRIKGDTARKAIGFLVSALTIGVIVGMLTAGAASSFITNFTVVLLVPVVLVIAAIAAVFFAVPESTTRSPRGIDFLGFAGLAAAMIAFLWGLRQAQTAGFGSTGSLVPLGLAALILLGWGAWERRVKNPAVDLQMFGSRSMWPVYAISFLAGMVIIGSTTILPTFLASDPTRVGYGFALSPGNISIVTAGGVVFATVGAALFAFIAKRIGMRGLLILATVVGAAGNLSLAFFNTEMWQIWMASIATMFAFGSLTGALPALVAEQAPDNQTGIAAGMYNSVKTLGGSAASACFGVVLASSMLPGTRNITLQGYSIVWILCALAFALCPLVLTLLKSSSTQSDHATADPISGEKLVSGDRTAH